MFWLRKLCLCAAPKADDSGLNRHRFHANTSEWPTLELQGNPLLPGKNSASTLAKATCSRLLTQPPKSEKSDGHWLSHIGAYLSICKTSLSLTDVRLVIFSSESLSAWLISEAKSLLQAEGWGSSLGKLLRNQGGSLVAVVRDYYTPTQVAASFHHSQDRSMPQAGVPDPRSVVLHNCDQPMPLSPRDLLIIPVRHNDQLTAALVLCVSDWAQDSPNAQNKDADQGGPVAAQGPPALGDKMRDSRGGAVSLNAEDLHELQRLARIVVFGLLAPDPLHAHFLTKAAGYFGTLPLIDSLAELVQSVLDAITNLLAMRFSLRLHPVLAISPGLHAGLAALFIHRNAAKQQLLQSHRDSMLDTQASIQSLLSGTVPPTAVVTAAETSQIVPSRPSSATMGDLNLRVGGSQGLGWDGGVSKVKAVRTALAGTLLAEALRDTPAAAVMEAVAWRDAGAGGGGGGTSRARSQADSSPVVWYFGSSGGPAADSSIGATAAPGNLPGLLPPISLQRLTTVTVRDASRLVLDERHPCRDILTMNKLLGSGVGSLVLCLDASGTTSRSTTTTMETTATAPAANTFRSSDSCDPRGAGTSLGASDRSSPAAATGQRTAAVESHLRPRPVFGLYLLSCEVLPSSMLQAVMAECQLLFGLALDGVRAAIDACGRVEAELRSLQAQLRDGASATAGVSPLKLAREPGGANPTAAHRCLRMVTGVRQDVQPVRPHSQADKQMVLNVDRGAVSQGGVPCLPLTPSTELVLEKAAGPSQLELMVSSMRSQLGSILTAVEATEEARDLVKQDMAALVMQDVIARGGQGIVFRGFLHGLETAIKVAVYRYGESLAEDEQPRRRKASKGGAGSTGSQAAATSPQGVISTAAQKLDLDEEHGARLRRVKRDAMEHALTSTLSHPNIVQVYATFNNCVVVRNKQEGKPRLRLCTHEESLKAGWTDPGPLNQVLCLEYCDCGTLLSAAQQGAFRPEGASGFTALIRPALVPLYTSLLEIALALRYLHSRRLVHCDLKPANVLLKSSSRDPRGWTCKLSDFGCARLMTPVARSQDELRRLFSEAGGSGVHQKDSAEGPRLGFHMAMPLGTLAYMAPECFIMKHLLDSAVDVYSFGIMMYELLTCQPPYLGVQAKDIPRQVVRWNLRPEFHPLAPNDYCSLAVRCWATDPAARPTASRLVYEIERLLQAAKQEAATRKEQQELVLLPAGPAQSPHRVSQPLFRPFPEGPAEPAQPQQSQLGSRQGPPRASEKQPPPEPQPKPQPQPQPQPPQQLRPDEGQQIRDSSAGTAAPAVMDQAAALAEEAAASTVAPRVAAVVVSPQPPSPCGQQGPSQPRPRVQRVPCVAYTVSADAAGDPGTADTTQGPSAAALSESCDGGEGGARSVGTL